VYRPAGPVPSKPSTPGPRAAVREASPSIVSADDSDAAFHTEREVERGVRAGLRDATAGYGEHDLRADDVRPRAALLDAVFGDNEAMYTQPSRPIASTRKRPPSACPSTVRPAESAAFSVARRDERHVAIHARRAHDDRVDARRRVPPSVATPFWSAVCAAPLGVPSPLHAASRRSDQPNPQGRRMGIASQNDAACRKQARRTTCDAVDFPAP